MITSTPKPMGKNTPKYLSDLESSSSYSPTIISLPILHTNKFTVDNLEPDASERKDNTGEIGKNVPDKGNELTQSKLNRIKLTPKADLTPIKSTPKIKGSINSIPKLVYKRQMEQFNEKNKKLKPSGSPLKNEVPLGMVENHSFASNNANNANFIKSRSVSRSISGLASSCYENYNLNIPVNLNFITWIKFGNKLISRLDFLKNQLILKRFILMKNFHKLGLIIDFYCVSLDKFNDKIFEKFKVLQLKARELVESLTKL